MAKYLDSTPATDTTWTRKGNFRALLQEIQCFTEKNMQTQEPEVSLTYVFNLGDLDDKGQDEIFYQGFVTVPRNDETGMPKMSGKKSRYYKITSALANEMFDPKDEKVSIRIGFPDEYASLEGILNMPSFKDYTPGEERLKLHSYLVNGKELIGQECNILLDHANKPDGTPSDRISIVEATAIAKEVKRVSPPQKQAVAPAGAPV